MGGKRLTEKQVFDIDLSRRRAEIFDAFVQSYIDEARELRLSGNLEAAFVAAEYVEELRKWVRDVRAIIREKSRGAPFGEMMAKELIVAAVEELATQPGNGRRSKRTLLSRSSWDIQERINRNGRN